MHQSNSISSPAVKIIKIKEEYDSFIEAKKVFEERKRKFEESFGFAITGSGDEEQRIEKKLKLDAAFAICRVCRSKSSSDNQILSLFEENRAEIVGKVSGIDVSFILLDL
jgi:hypothetical protein